MRITHLSDTHLGHRRFNHRNDDGINECEDDGYRVFGEAIDKSIAAGVGAVVHSGDLFDVYHPSTRALGAALDGFAKLRDAGIPAVVIAGNHSTPRHRDDAHVFAVLERFGAEAIWEEPRTVRFGGLAVHGIPHHNDAQTLTRQIAEAAPDPGADFNVLALHVGLENVPDGAHEASSVDLDPEVLGDTATFDYVALGHLHHRLAISANACWAGSLERMSFGDRADHKGFVIVDSDRHGQADFLQFVDVNSRANHVLGPIDVTGVDELIPVIANALSGLDLEGAMVQCELTGVDQAAWRALSQGALATLKQRCLAFRLLPSFAGSAVPPSGASVDLHAFIAERVPAGVAVDGVLAKADGYLEQARAELQDDTEEGQ
jgi:DNA repair protein SbcD/Mre11